MRIRKNRCVPRQMPSYKYCVSTGWLMHSHEARNGPSPRYNNSMRLALVKAVKSGGEYGDRKTCSCDRKQEEDESVGIQGGEEPRTPPPCYGDKLSIPRLREQQQQQLQQQQQQQLDKVEKAPEVSLSNGAKPLGSSSCSCGKRKRTARAPDLVKGESSVRRKRVRVSGHASSALPSRVERDTAEPSSHDNCGPEQQRLENAEAIRAAKYLQEISKIDDPLLRAMHTVVSEAGIEGLTARETAERIISKGLLSEADIPRSVKMAKAMRDSPYLMEINKSSSRFVLWSTFLEESSKSKGEEAPGACRRRKRSWSSGQGIVIGGGGGEVKVVKEEERGVENLKADDQAGAVPRPLAVPLPPPPPPPPKRFMLDLNVVPDDDEQVYS